MEKLKTRLDAAGEDVKAVTVLCDEAQMKALAATIAASGKTMAEVVAWIKDGAVVWMALIINK